MSDTVNVGRRVTISNLVKRPLVLSLNSKESLYLAPGARAAGIAEHEVVGNPDVKKLQASNWIQCAVEAPAEAAREPEGQEHSKPAPKDK